MKNIQLLGFEGEAPEESLVSRGTPLYFDGTDHFLGKAKLENEKYFLWLKEKNFFVFFSTPICVEEIHEKIVVTKAESAEFFNFGKSVAIDGWKVSTFDYEEMRSQTQKVLMDLFYEHFRFKKDIPKNVLSTAFGIAPKNYVTHALLYLCEKDEDRKKYIHDRAKALLRPEDYLMFIFMNRGYFENCEDDHGTH